MCRFNFFIFSFFFFSNLFAQVNTSNITIVRDKWGVPHIYGNTDKDVAYFKGKVESYFSKWVEPKLKDEPHEETATETSDIPF